MSYRNRNIKVAKRMNAEKRCIYHPDRYRVQLSRYCAECLRRFRRCGSGQPGSKIFHLRHYRMEAAETMEIIRLNIKNPLIAEAVAVVQRLYFRAVKGISIPGLTHSNISQVLVDPVV